MFYSFRS